MALIDTMFTKRALLLSKIAPHKNGTQHKWHPIRIASHKNDISQKWHLKTYIVAFLKYYQHPANRTYTYN